MGFTVHIIGARGFPCSPKLVTVFWWGSEDCLLYRREIIEDCQNTVWGRRTKCLSVCLVIIILTLKRLVILSKRLNMFPGNLVMTYNGIALCGYSKMKVAWLYSTKKICANILKLGTVNGLDSAICQGKRLVIPDCSHFPFPRYDSSQRGLWTDCLWGKTSGKHWFL